MIGVERFESFLASHRKTQSSDKLVAVAHILNRSQNFGALWVVCLCRKRLREIMKYMHIYLLTIRWIFFTTLLF